MLFAEGNGCSPDLMQTWILLSQAWNDAKTAGKRLKQIDFIVDNLEQKRASFLFRYKLWQTPVTQRPTEELKRMDRTLTFNFHVS